MEEQGIYFPSEKSVFLGIVLWGPFVGVPFLGYKDVTLIPMLIGMTVYFIMIPWVWFTTGYRITATRLYVKCGPLDFDVPLSSIRSVQSTWSPIASAALSFRRLLITLENGERFMISPKDRERFIALLRDRCPQACFKLEEEE